MRRYRTQFFLLILLSILATTIGLIFYARGYKLDLAKKTLKPTGLLVATSTPNGASVLIDGKLTTATNNTISLAPEEYQVEIRKDGYLPWKKSLKIEREVVTKADAYLFPAVPDLRPLTYTGVQNPVISPDGAKILYNVPFSDNDELTIKAGLWILDLSDGPFGLNSKEPRQILKSAPKGYDFAKFEYQWSPDSRQILITLKAGASQENFLIDPNQLTPDTQLVDVTPSLPLIIKQWQKDTEDKEIAQLAKLSKQLAKILQSSASDLVWSADNTKILYTATASASIPENLVPSLPSASTQKQERDIKPNHIYTYDIKEDRNFLIGDRRQEIGDRREKTPNSQFPIPNSLSWLPTSRHLVHIEPEKITIMDYDSTNRQKIYQGFFEYPLVFPAPSADKLILLTRLTSDEESPLNLYALSLR